MNSAADPSPHGENRYSKTARPPETTPRPRLTCRSVYEMVKESLLSPGEDVMKISRLINRPAQRRAKDRMSLQTIVGHIFTNHRNSIRKRPKKKVHEDCRLDPDGPTIYMVTPSGERYEDTKQLEVLKIERLGFEKEALEDVPPKVF
ncbi:hypothetical protein TWF281_001720 [Arthrobotrys megalospora]